MESEQGPPITYGIKQTQSKANIKLNPLRVPDGPRPNILLQTPVLPPRFAGTPSPPVDNYPQKTNQQQYNNQQYNQQPQYTQQNNQQPLSNERLNVNAGASVRPPALNVSPQPSGRIAEQPSPGMNESRNSFNSTNRSPMRQSRIPKGYELADFPRTYQYLQEQSYMRRTGKNQEEL